MEGDPDLMADRFPAQSTRAAPAFRYPEHILDGSCVDYHVRTGATGATGAPGSAKLVHHGHYRDESATRGPRLRQLKS